MRKRIVIACIALIATLSVYGVSHILFAVSESGQIGELSEGDKIILGSASTGEVVWDVGVKNNDNYVLMTSQYISKTPACNNNTENTGTYSKAGYVYMDVCEYITTASGKSNSPIYDEIAHYDQNFSQSIDSHALESTMMMTQSDGNKYAFIPTTTDLKVGGRLNISKKEQVVVGKDTGANSGYFVIGRGYSAGKLLMTTVSNADSTFYEEDNRTAYPGWIVRGYGKFSGSNPISPYYVNYNVRAFSQMKRTDNLVFAADASIHDNDLHMIGKQTVQGDLSVAGAKKLRIFDGSLGKPVINGLYNSKDEPLTNDSIAKNSTVVIKYQATSVGGSKYLTMLCTDVSGNLVYYKRLTNIGGNSYSLDTTGMNLGSYQFYVVVEEINDTTGRPAKSSLISNMAELKIVEPLTLTVTSKSNFEVKKNVNQGDVVGTYLTNHGVSPISVTLVGDASMSGHENDYQLFDVSNGNIIVKEPNGLNAGDYYFKVNAVDANGDPDGGVESNVIHIVVSKADTTIAFDQPNQTKKTVEEAETNWSEPATATPSDGTKITYTIVGGDIGLIDLDEDTGEVTYQGNGAFGKVKIRATVDDDPDTGNDNYNSSFVEKEIVITREVDGVVTPDPASSDITVPTFSMDQANIKVNGIIGTIKGTLGTPDTIGGNTTTYSYQIKSGGNASFFKVNSSTGVIQTNANLAVGTYTFEITVSDKWSSKDISVTVNVGMSPAEELKFYENSSSDTIITKKSVKVTDTGVTVFATVKGSTNNNPVTYRLKDGEPTNVIDVNPNSGAVTIKNVGKVIILAEKKGSTGQADAVTELEFTVTAGAQEFIYVDESGNELPKTLDKYQTYEEVYGKDKTFKVHTDGNPPGSTVTYALKAGSPTDVITVDEDGTIHILNASLNTQKGKVIVLATSHDPNGNYEDKTIELPIDITKADQKISFADITNAPNGKGTVTPIITEQDLSSNDGGVTVEDPDYYISVGASGSGIAWTNNGIDIEYDYDEEEGIEIPIHVEKPGNRNYNKAEADGTLKILGQDESTLAINQPGKVVYGDHFTIRSLQDDSSSTNVQYKFEVNNTIYISQPNVNGNKAEFDALKFSGNTEIEIKVTRTADGEVPLSKTIKIKVLPKDINITIDDKQKKQGEENPELTFQDFQDQLVSWNGVKDQVDSDDVKLTTTATTTSKGGSYPITGNPKTMNGKYPNYNFIFTDGKLMVEGIIDKDVDGDGEPDFNDPDGDGCPDLNIKWKEEDGNWVVINGDRDYDGIPDLNIDSDGDGVPDLNIDTDHDGKPDINLVILTKAQWK
ncbi:MAG: cadherin repeat domain-containing protein, partial [Erysipelotrichaceae bacterium]|nr:cadherin repeat domain-containing protein [Erysipelotrichaceae bacterium]